MLRRTPPDMRQSEGHLGATYYSLPILPVLVGPVLDSVVLRFVYRGGPRPYGYRGSRLAEG